MLLVAGVMVIALFVVSGDSSAQQVCGRKCGKERWAIKTLSDPDSASVNLTPKSTSVDWLISQPAPEHLADKRIPPIETQVFQVSALLIGFKGEPDDGDFHIVIADPALQSETMIVEIGDSSCQGVCASIKRKEIEQARQNFVAHCGAPATKFKRLHPPLPVIITGVGFFDVTHGQMGVAENAIELHPVLDFQFPTDTNDCQIRVGKRG
jgi:hypothetical protein